MVIHYSSSAPQRRVYSRGSFPRRSSLLALFLMIMLIPAAALPFWRESETPQQPSKRAEQLRAVGQRDGNSAFHFRLLRVFTKSRR